MTPLVGAVLCGGSSRRMGTDKALLEIDGVPLAERVAGVLEAAGCAPVVFVGGEPLGARATGRPFVPDRSPGAGPVGGVITRAARGGGRGDGRGVVPATFPISPSTPCSRVIAAPTRFVDESGSPTAAGSSRCSRIWPRRALPPRRGAVRRRRVALHDVIADSTRSRPGRIPAAVRNANRPPMSDRLNPRIGTVNDATLRATG